MTKTQLKCTKNLLKRIILLVLQEFFIFLQDLKSIKKMYG